MTQPQRRTPHFDKLPCILGIQLEVSIPPAQELVFYGRMTEPLG